MQLREIVKRASTVWPGSCQRMRLNCVVVGMFASAVRLLGASAARDGAPAEGLVVVVLRHMAVDVDPAQQGKDQRESG